MISIRRQFIDGPFGQVHIRIAQPDTKPTTTPLICLHQSPKSGREFIEFMEHAADDRTIVAIDSPGHGESDVPTSMALATIPNYARSAIDIITKLGFEKVDLLGNHTGSSVALEVAHQSPDQVQKLVLISAPIYTKDEVETFKDMFQPVPMDEEGTRYVESWKKAIQYRGPGVSLEALADSFAENFRAGEAYEWGHQAAFENSPRFPERLKSLNHKVIVINPGDLLFEATLRARPFLNNGEIINYPEWGIGFLNAYPKDAAREILKALN